MGNKISYSVSHDKIYYNHVYRVLGHSRATENKFSISRVTGNKKWPIT